MKRGVYVQNAFIDRNGRPYLDPFERKPDRNLARLVPILGPRMIIGRKAEFDNFKSMPIQIELRDGAIGVVYHCHGAMTIEDFFNAGKAFLAAPEEIRKWRYELIDLTHAESMDIHFNEVSNIVPQNDRIAADAVPSVLLAVASPNDLGYGLARMGEALVERV